LYYLRENQKEFTSLALKNSFATLSQGQPLELIDGDNLLFMEGVKDVFKNIENKDADTLVVSVIGPQSAGKSLLMNFLFGCQFLTSAGRCTKGIYCSVIKYKNKRSGKMQNILILDTEGIQSAEARDFYFDRRVVYFIMCISHVVLICNKQEMN